MTVRNVLLAVVVLAAFALGACSPEDPFIQTPKKTTVKNPAFLRVIHAAADGPEVEVLVGDSLFFDKYDLFPIDNSHVPASNEVCFTRSNCQKIHRSSPGRPPRTGRE